MWYYTSHGIKRYGEMSEWFKELVLKTSDSLCGPWVRIPLSPPTRICRKSNKAIHMEKYSSR